VACATEKGIALGFITRESLGRTDMPKASMHDCAMSFGRGSMLSVRQAQGAAGWLAALLE
jgi:hypothetical protein